MNSEIQSFLLALVPVVPFLISIRIIFDFIRSILFKGWTEN